MPRFNSPIEGLRLGEAWRGTLNGSRKTKREFYWEGTPHGSIPAKNSLGVPAISMACVRAHMYEPTRPQANTRTLLFREIATRPRRFKRLPNEVWLRKHGTYTRARGGAYTARRSGNASFDYPEGYETNQADEYARIFRCISHGWDAAGGVSPAGEVFLCASGLPDRLGQESIALPTCTAAS